jgi:nucleotide-binding universal stress UspA family protein
VLTIGLLPDPVPADVGSFKRILCATDFSPCSIAAWRYAESLAAGSGAHLALLHVVEVPPVVADPVVGPLIDVVKYQEAAETLCRERLQRLTGSAPNGVEEMVTAGKPYREILRIADEWRSDLIVLGIHGRNPIDRMLFGSTAELVTRRATCPILTVRDEAEPVSPAA